MNVNLAIRHCCFALVLIVPVALLSATCRGEDQAPICCEDFTGSILGVRDREVNVNDLLALLSQWGLPPANYPNADFFPRSPVGCPDGGDAEVNVNDLLALLAAWGPCDEPYETQTKALAPGSTYTHITADGVYPFRILGVLDGPLRGPTDDFGEVISGPSICAWVNFGTGNAGGFQFGDSFGIDMSTDPFTIGGDVWFHYTASCDGTLNITTSASSCDNGYITDPMLEVYPGSASVTDWQDLLVCGDDSGGGCGLQAQVELSVETGEVYIIRIGGWLGEQGDGNIDVSCVESP